jgi:hypothetical protein
MSGTLVIFGFGKIGVAISEGIADALLEDKAANTAGRFWPRDLPPPLPHTPL